MADKTVYELQAEVCKSLAHPLRIEVIDLLRDGERSFGDLLEQTGGLKSNLSQHLSVMANRGILKARKDSRFTYYSLSSVKVADACSLMREVLVEKLEKQRDLLGKF